MKPTFTRPATLADAHSVAQRLRPEDRDEVLMASGIDPRLVLPAYVQGGREVYASGIEGGPAEILWGVDPVYGVPGGAVPWLLSTPAMFAHPVEFVVMSRRLWDGLHGRFEVLTNFVWAGNARHIRWLQWLGATVFRPVPLGPRSALFHKFTSNRQKCHTPTPPNGGPSNEPTT